ncbi:MAG: type II toxin-antitoxin system HicB family antitoxin [Chloroflexi bacterium]|nr:type II toxin-antitoxin system HicB family antitoxin [Chloroflexota bacterium]
MAITYPALIDGEPGAFGVVFPDVAGIGAMGATVDEALGNAKAVLIGYAIEMERDGLPLAAPSRLEVISVPQGNQLTSVTVN